MTKLSLLPKAVGLSLVVLAVQQSAGMVRALYDASIAVPQQIKTPFEERFVEKTGGPRQLGWIYIFTRFLNQHTPEHAVIFIPPQGYSWEVEGNAGYIRWFIYPRETRSSKTLEDPIPPDADYVLITNGMSAADVHGWPRIPIPAEKIETIWLINPATHDVTEAASVDYSYQPQIEKWGLIKLRK
jgi:hypothetical protein